MAITIKIKVARNPPERKSPSLAARFFVAIQDLFFASTIILNFKLSKLTTMSNIFLAEVEDEIALNTQLFSFLRFQVVDNELFSFRWCRSCHSDRLIVDFAL